MSIDFGSRYLGSSKRVAAEQIAMAAAGALAFSLLVGGVAMRESSTTVSITQPRSRAENPYARQLAAPISSRPSVTIYVVESAAEAQLLQAGIASVAGPDVTGHVMQVFVADTPEQIDLLELLQNELGQLDNTRVVDLRYSGALDGLRPR